MANTNPLTRQTSNVFCPTGKGGGIDPTCGKGGRAKVFGGSSLDKLAVKLVADQFPATRQEGFYGVKLIPEDEPGREFKVGSNNFQQAGEYDPQLRKVTSKAEPGILAHELGHDEYHYILDESQYQLNGAATYTEGNKLDVFDYYVSPDGRIKNPTSSRENLYNANMDFHDAISRPEDHPSDYSRAWASEPVVDFPRVSAKKFTRPEDGTQFDFDVRSHRSVNEAYAEFSRGAVLDDLVKKGLVDDYAGRPSFKKMGTPQSRRAFLSLRKAAHENLKGSG